MPKALARGELVWSGYLGRGLRPVREGGLKATPDTVTRSSLRKLMLGTAACVCDPQLHEWSGAMYIEVNTGAPTLNSSLLSPCDSLSSREKGCNGYGRGSAVVKELGDDR